MTLASAYNELIQLTGNIKKSAWHELWKIDRMKETIFYILISIRTGNGFESIGKFYIGDSRERATTIFRQLTGHPDVNEKTILTLDLVETIDELPLNMQMITCSLKELAENCRIIVREAFKLFNL